MDELEKRIQKLDEAITDLEEDCEEEIREIMKEYLMLDFIGEE